MSEAIAAAESFGARFVDPDALGGILRTISWAVLSPGVPPISPVVRAIHRADVPVMGEIELAYRLCKAPIVAVTGTKGKSTTTALIGHLLRGCGRQARVGGNIGNPLIKEIAGGDVCRLDRRRGLVVSARNDSRVQTARRRLTQHRARPSRPVPFDGRVCRSQVPHLRQSVDERLVRRQPRRSENRSPRVAPRQRSRPSAPALVHARRERTRHDVSTRRSHNLRPGHRRSASDPALAVQRNPAAGRP